MNELILVETPPRLREADLCAWLGAALPGDSLVYHRGFLAVDCDYAISHLSKPERTRLTLVARRARLAEERGLVHLIQRRHGPDDYDYLIVARRRPRSQGRDSGALMPAGCRLP
jgi:hypothetical protein